MFSKHIRDVNLRCVNWYFQKTKLGEFVRVGCGRCILCLKRRASEWSMRMKHELSTSGKGLFVTLTYNDICAPYKLANDIDEIILPKVINSFGEEVINVLVKKDIQLFNKRLRRRGYKYKYYITGEYGSKTKRPHYHAILFGLGVDKNVIKDIREIWNKGMVHIGGVETKSIEYVAKYLVSSDRRDKYPKGHEPFSLMSKGIGLEFAEKNRDVMSSGKMIVKGKRVSIPRYYTKKGIVSGEVINSINKEKREEYKKKFEKSGMSFDEFIKAERENYKVSEIDKKKRKEAYGGKL